jgi:hypothetical protein
VKEEDVVKNEAATWKPKLRLSREQSDDQQALEDEIKFAKKEVDEAGEDAGKQAAANAALAAKEAELKAMLDGFEVRHPINDARRARAGQQALRHPAAAPAARITRAIARSGAGSYANPKPSTRVCGHGHGKCAPPRTAPRAAAWHGRRSC